MSVDGSWLLPRSGSSWEQYRPNSLDRATCTLVPTHRPHYPVLRRLLSSLELFAQDRVPILLLFTTMDMTEVCGPIQSACQTVEGSTLDALTHLPAQSLSFRIDGSLRNKYASPNYFTQALKKILGVAASNCERVWVVDSDTLAFRSFSIRQLVSDFWARPTVFTQVRASHEPNQRAIAMLLRTSSAAAAKLARTVYRHADYWHYRTASVRAMIAHVERAWAIGPSLGGN